MLSVQVVRVAAPLQTLTPSAGPGAMVPVARRTSIEARSPSGSLAAQRSVTAVEPLYVAVKLETTGATGAAVTLTVMQLARFGWSMPGMNVADHAHAVYV